MPKRLSTIFMIFCLVLSSGCIKRNLYIKSDPPEATVYFDEVDIGTTPLDYDFQWYAVHKIRLKKEGYEDIEELVKIRSPILFWIPFDIFFELIPYVFRHDIELSYTLTPTPASE